LHEVFNKELVRVKKNHALEMEVMARSEPVDMPAQHRSNDYFVPPTPTRKVDRGVEQLAEGILAKFNGRKTDSTR